MARETFPRLKPHPKLESSNTGWQLPPRANPEEHRFESLEPYEMKVSRTVPRGGWAGDSLPPLDSLPELRDTNRATIQWVDGPWRPSQGALPRQRWQPGQARSALALTPMPLVPQHRSARPANNL